jgi:hypothetical protein
MNQNGKAVELYREIQKQFPNQSYYSGAAAAFEKKLAAQGATP